MLQDAFIQNIPVHDISFFFNGKIRADVLRLDTIHPVISGNKWFKLRYYIEQAIASGETTIVTFGGAWSNHIVAAAALCKMRGLHVYGIIRGEEPAVFSATLREARRLGMELLFMSRSEYNNKTVPPGTIPGPYYIIPEGGYGDLGAKGAATILDHCPPDYSHYCCAVGTGTMMAGLSRAVLAGQQVTGIAVLRDVAGLEKNVAALAGATNWQIVHDYHHGGYAKHDPALLRFMNLFYRETNIPSDFVYTGKLFFAINDMVENDFFPPGSRLLLVHSGGLQGNASLGKGTLIF
jgi:1-aminocyclopropane-1-carboxylate deaminase